MPTGIVDVYQSHVVVNDTQSDSIQYLNFAKKWFIQYSIQYRFTQDSIQNIIQFKKNSADSIQKIIQFNSQGLFDTGRIGKVPENCPKSVQNRQKRGLFIKNGKYRFKIWFIHSFHGKIQFKGLFNIIFFRNIQFKKLFNNFFFPENSIQKLIQKFKFGFIQFNKIFIQLENQGIEHHYFEAQCSVYDAWSLFWFMWALAFSALPKDHIANGQNMS